MSAQAAVPGSTTTTEDVALFGRVARGESAALKVLYDRHAAKALGVATRVLGIASEAEEVVQETFVQVWKRAREYDGKRGAASVWIATIARSRAIDRLRARGASVRKLAAIGNEPIAPNVASPLENVEARLAREQIGIALGTLPPEQRRTIELAFFEGLTHREIAERTEQPLGTVKTRVRLAMEKLAALLTAVRP